MAVSNLFLDIELTPVVPIVCCMSFVWDFVCVVSGLKSILCGGFSLRYVRALGCVMCGL